MTDNCVVPPLAETPADRAKDDSGEFADAVGNQLSRIVRQGIVAALDDYLAEPAVI